MGNRSRCFDRVLPRRRERPNLPATVLTPRLLNFPADWQLPTERAYRNHDIHGGRGHTDSSKLQATGLLDADPVCPNDAQSQTL